LKDPGPLAGGPCVVIVGLGSPPVARQARLH
jgi:hypothetical protein